MRSHWQRADYVCMASPESSNKSHEWKCSGNEPKSATDFSRRLAELCGLDDLTRLMIRTKIRAVCFQRPMTFLNNNYASVCIVLQRRCFYRDSWCFRCCATFLGHSCATMCECAKPIIQIAEQPFSFSGLSLALLTPSIPVMLRRSVQAHINRLSTFAYAFSASSQQARTSPESIRIDTKIASLIKYNNLFERL